MRQQGVFREPRAANGVAEEFVVCCAWISESGNWYLSNFGLSSALPFWDFRKSRVEKMSKTASGYTVRIDLFVVSLGSVFYSFKCEYSQEDFYHSSFTQHQLCMVLC